MKVLLTGQAGYVGSVMVPTLVSAGHHVTGLDAGFFDSCTFGPAEPPTRADGRDLRDVTREDLVGFDAVVHLAALSNDPLGAINPALTYAINHAASVRLAALAKEAGVPRFLFASSCSLYGVQGDHLLDEDADFNPITAYGESKVLVERDLLALADDGFSPVFLRNATAYGMSPRLRTDIVVNNLVAHAVTRGEVLIQSDGTPWRPLVHVADFTSAFLAALTAPRELVHAQAFNVGRTRENYRVHELAEMVEAAVPGSQVRYAPGGGPDPRSYRVSCAKLEDTLPDYRPEWTVERGIRELADAYSRGALDPADFDDGRYARLPTIRRQMESGRLGDDLRWTAGAREDVA